MEETTVIAPVPPGVRSSTFSSLLCRTPSALRTIVCFVVVFTIFGATVAEEDEVVKAKAAFWAASCVLKRVNSS